jgi:hypothetical protein
MIRSGPLDHRGLWTIDLEYFRYRELEESGLAHVQTSKHQITGSGRNVKSIRGDPSRTNLGCQIQEKNIAREEIHSKDN